MLDSIWSTLASSQILVESQCHKVLWFHQVLQGDQPEGLSDYLNRMNRLLDQTQQEHEQVLCLCIGIH